MTTPAALPNCIEAGPGKGLCDHCAEGRTEFCRYVLPVKTVSAIDALRQQLADSERTVVELREENARLLAMGYDVVQKEPK